MSNKIKKKVVQNCRHYFCCVSFDKNRTRVTISKTLNSKCFLCS